MNPSLRLRENLDIPNSQNILKSPLAISKFLALTQINSGLISEFSQSFNIHQFQLGEEILCTHSNLSGLTQDSVQHEQYEQNIDQKTTIDFYLVCQGQVRLLCHPPESRETTALLLGADESFGAARLFCDPGERVLPYRAIAASPVQVARLPADTLGLWLKQFPQLFEHLLSQTQLRQRLIFFKTSSGLRSLSSHQLKQFVPHLSELILPAGKLLAESAPDSLGHFWLRQGKVAVPQETNLQNQLNLTGTVSDWGYPAQTPADWIAQTDLSVYRLSAEAWETVQALLPALSPTSDAIDFLLKQMAIATARLQARADRSRILSTPLLALR